MVSIIIVHYHVKKELFDCLTSIIKSTKNTSYEIIVVDNDEEKAIGKELHNKFQHIIYIPNENRGFGQGCNIGALYAKGEYLLFLNPDTKLLPRALDLLISFLKRNKSAGVVAPLLLHGNKKPFKLQGTSLLTPIYAIFSLSFLARIFPNNYFYCKYWKTEWDRTKLKEVDVVPGTAFAVRREIFAEVHGFDENFFLYFEEFDLCKRIREKGHKLYIFPESQIIHLWENSTRQRSDINKIFKKSRLYYFKKHYGVFSALMVELFARFGKFEFAIIIIVLLSFFLNFYKLSLLMTFIGDQGWFYLSARDMLLTGHLPLVGITSSHPWLHQGPIWTYLLAGALLVGKFDPVSGGYLSACIGVLTVVALALLVKELLNRRVAAIAALLYTTSPFIVFHTRMPYHTSPIPLFVILLLYSVFKLVRGHPKYLTLTTFSLAVLYNLEVATVVYAYVLFIFFGFAFICKKEWFSLAKNLKLLILSAVTFVVPMLPIFIYDTSHGYPQTLKFAAWNVYNVLKIFGFHLHPIRAEETWGRFFSLSAGYMQKLFFLQSVWIALLLLLLSLGAALFYVVKSKETTSFRLLFGLWIFLPFVAYVATKTPSDAYTPMLFPGLMVSLAIMVEYVYRIKRYAAIFLLMFIVASNVYGLLSTDFLTGGAWRGLSLRTREKAAQYIVGKMKNTPYRLVGYGPGSQFVSYTMNYEYLTWWMGNGPTGSGSTPVRITDIPPKIVVQVDHAASQIFSSQ